MHAIHPFSIEWRGWILARKCSSKNFRFTRRMFKLGIRRYDAPANHDRRRDSHKNDSARYGKSRCGRCGFSHSFERHTLFDSLPLLDLRREYQWHILLEWALSQEGETEWERWTAFSFYLVGSLPLSTKYPNTWSSLNTCHWRILVAISSSD